MENNLIFLPVLMLVLLVLLLYIVLVKAKARASKEGNVDEARRSLHGDAWPESVQKVNNCIGNQFEVPVLFYVLVLVIWSVSAVNILVHALAWLFVLSRFVHAYIHIGRNHVPHRRAVFSIGCLLLLLLTLFAMSAVAMTGIS